MLSLFSRKWMICKKQTWFISSIKINERNIFLWSMKIFVHKLLTIMKIFFVDQ